MNIPSKMPLQKYPIPLVSLLLLPFLLQPSVLKTLTLTPSPPLISINTTILSPNRTFELGFFSVDGGSSYYLGIWYASIPIPTYVWVANRISPVLSPPPSAFLTTSGHLAVLDSSGSVQWQTDNSVPAAAVQLHDTGNLALLPVGGGDAPDIAWQSFDFPADTWLPEMPVTRSTAITSWRSPTDPSPGDFSLRLRPQGLGEFELVFNGSVSYWRTGNWTGTRFAGVPEMTVPYIYDFRFSNPFTPEAAFDYSQSFPEESGLRLLLSRFVVDSSGQLMQYTWSSQATSWNVFWSRPENPCRVYARCGRMGFCAGRRCSCPSGLRPVNPAGWNSGDFSGGCFNNAICPVIGVDDDSVFDEIGSIQFDDAVDATLVGVSRRYCEDSCRKNCSCFGITYNSDSRTCTNLYDSAYNLRNSTSSTILFIKNIPGIGNRKRKRIKWKMIGVLIAITFALVSNLAIAAALGFILVRRHHRRKRMEEEYGGLKVFTYKELSSATRGFSEKLGQGGFGVVFRGTLPDSTPVAVKRLERPGGGGDREFRAEVRTIGSVQHVNLVRLRGFCSEDPQRLLVYDYMPNGPLSAYLNRSSNPPPLTWPARFRIAVGTARGIAYLHEECHDCIIHCDIKPENILLDLDFTPRVSDFGLAKLVGRDLGSRVLATTRGTRGYVAPEWISGVAITAKADVYSYGMTLMEIIGGRRNVEAPEEGDEEWFFPAVAARRIVEGDLESVVEEAEGFDGMEAERAGRVAVWCIQDEEGDRPEMGTVVKMLEGTVEVAVPPLPEMLQAIVAGESFRRWEMGSGVSGGVLSAEEIRVENGSGMAGDCGVDLPR